MRLRRQTYQPAARSKFFSLDPAESYIPRLPVSASHPPFPFLPLSRETCVNNRKGTGRGRPYDVTKGCGVSGAKRGRVHTPPPFLASGGHRKKQSKRKTRRSHLLFFPFSFFFFFFIWAFQACEPRREKNASTPPSFFPSSYAAGPVVRIQWLAARRPSFPPPLFCRKMAGEE